jgi:hypothetical protein
MIKPFKKRINIPKQGWERLCANLSSPRPKLYCPGNFGAPVAVSEARDSAVKALAPSSAAGSLCGFSR